MAPYRIPPAASKVTRELVYPAPADHASLSSVLLWLWRRLVAMVTKRAVVPERDFRRVVLRVDEGRFSLMFGDERALAVPLHALLDVELDTRSIEKLQGRARPDGLLETGASMALDVSRLVLVTSDCDRGIPLSRAYASYSEAQVWLGKVRTFLRRHGWLPQDERE